MKQSTFAAPVLSPVNGKPILLNFDGAEMSSDAGLTLLRQVERRLGLAGVLASCLTDLRDPGNGARVRLWKHELQGFANETGLAVTVVHHPPGTSKWNRIEHRLFAFITQNWRGKPLLSHEVIVQLIGATTTHKGLDVQCQLDENSYPKAVRVTDAQISMINIDRDPFHGEWNYTIAPNLLQLNNGGGQP